MVHSAEQPTNVPLIRRSALLAQGFSEKEIVGMRRRGGWDRLAAGCYLPPTDLMPEEIHRLRVRAVAGRSPGLVISHQSAARLHGLPLFSVPTGRVHLIRPGRGGSHLRLGRQVHAAELPDSDIVELDGMLVTSCARTLFDLGRTLSFESAVVAIDFALHHELVSPGQLIAHIGRVGSGPGIGATRRALRFADGRSESVGESRTRVFFRTFSLPIPVPQLEIFDEVGTLLGRADLGITEYGTLIEFDGLAKYDELLAPGRPLAMRWSRRRSERMDSASVAGSSSG